MENYIVSARKYRPNAWESVVGQEAITSTLKNAITNNKLAQAYLFCGPRGVGKTTCARLFAKSINADAASFDEDFSFNIFELDGASNNKVEDIRSLIDQVRIPPQVGNYKVYIIDEVHMLSSGAFNAFLKTLEEPPKHAIFILATTEKHKVLPTILSRCQIYDFNRITVSDMAKHLAYICQQENVKFEEQALHVIAEKADGALRDALSMLDQLVSFSGGNLTYDVVIKNLHILDYDYYFKLTESFLRQDIPSALLIFDEILAKGFDGHHFINGLASHFRNLMVCKDASTLKLMDVSEEVKNRYLEQTKQTSLSFLLDGLEILSKADYEYKSSKNQRLFVELALMQLSSLLFEGAEKKKLVLN
jgi:DNA polymerase-3 subunit gamma/tau